MISGVLHLPEAHPVSSRERQKKYPLAGPLLGPPHSYMTTQALSIKLLQFLNETEDESAQRERMTYVKFIHLSFWKVGVHFYSHTYPIILATA